MTFFFDRNIGRHIPQALLHLRPPVRVEFHDRHFAPNTMDDVWLTDVGIRGWTVIAQDYKFHTRPSDRSSTVRSPFGAQGNSGLTH